MKIKIISHLPQQLPKSMNLYPNKHPDPEVDIGAITLCLPETKERENTILKFLIHSYVFFPTEFSIKPKSFYH